MRIGHVVIEFIRSNCARGKQSFVKLDVVFFAPVYGDLPEFAVAEVAPLVCDVVFMDGIFESVKGAAAGNQVKQSIAELGVVEGIAKILHDAVFVDVEL